MSAPIGQYRVRSGAPPLLVWVIVLGFAGFAAGFVGPVILNPSANQGPLVGIFITGPCGVLLGVLLWAIARAAKLSPQTQWRMMGIAAVILAGATLWVVRP